MTVAGCCEFHSPTCEPPSELCCQRCPEATHPWHTDGSICSSPELAAPALWPIQRLTPNSDADGRGLLMWVVYVTAPPYPTDHQAREVQVTGGDSPVPALTGRHFVGSLELVRAHLAGMGLYRLDRRPDDDPTIVETWL